MISHLLQSSSRMPIPVGRLLAGAGLLFIAATTLAPIPEQAPAARLTSWHCLVCGDHGGMDVVNNILLFIPFALGLRLAGVPTRLVVLLGAALSVTIELLQWSVVTGRDASLSDVLTNTLGSWLGASIGAHRALLLRPGRAQAIRLALAWGGLWLIIQAGSGGLLRPWIPTDQLRGIWARSVYEQPRFDGRVISSSVSGHPIAGDSSVVPAAVARALASGRFDLEVRFVSGRARRKSPVVEVLGPRGAVLAIEAVKSNLTLQAPMRSSILRLAQPSLRLPGALPGEPEVEVRVHAGEAGSTLWAEWESRGFRHRRELALSASLGWSLLVPFSYSYGEEVRLLTMLWVAGWLLPAGYWTARLGGRPFGRVIALLLLVGCGLALLPAALGYRPGHWSEWLAAFLGLGIGAVGQRFAAYFEKRCDSPSIAESCLS